MDARGRGAGAVDAWYLCVDIGGTMLRAAVGGAGGGLLVDGARATPAAAGGVEAAAAVYELCDEVIAGAKLGGTPAAVGVSFGGPVDTAGARILRSQHVAGWEDYPLASALSERYGAPVVMDNDANAAALGEHRFGAGRGARGLLYVTVSTGIGGGIVLDGRLWRGAGSLAGEIGHMVVRPDGRRCPCGKRGCVEAYASGTSLAARAREYLRANPGGVSRMSELARGEVERVDARTVFAAAGEGDEAAANLVEEALELLGLAVANAVSILDLDRVVIGGGMTREGRRFFEPVQRTVDRRSMFGRHHVPVLPSGLGDSSGLYGARALASG